MNILIFYADMSNWQRILGCGSVVLLIIKFLYVKYFYYFPLIYICVDIHPPVLLQYCV